MINIKKYFLNINIKTLLINILFFLRAESNYCFSKITTFVLFFLAVIGVNITAQ